MKKLVIDFDPSTSNLILPDGNTWNLLPEVVARLEYFGEAELVSPSGGFSVDELVSLKCAGFSAQDIISLRSK